MTTALATSTSNTTRFVSFAIECSHCLNACMHATVCVLILAAHHSRHYITARCWVDCHQRTRCQSTINPLNKPRHCVPTSRRRHHYHVDRSRCWYRRCTFFSRIRRMQSSVESNTRRQGWRKGIGKNRCIPIPRRIGRECKCKWLTALLAPLPPGPRSPLPPLPLSSHHQ